MTYDFGLYLDLEKGKYSDLKNVCEALLSLSSALEDALFVIDPSFSPEFDLISGDKGSLWIKIKTDFSKLLPEKTGETKKAILIVMLGGILHWSFEQTRDWAFEHLLDALSQSSYSQEVQDWAKKESEIIIKALKSKNIEADVKNFFRSLDADKAVKGVAISKNIKDKPKNLIPKSEFKARYAEKHEVEISEYREEHETEWVTLISPVLSKASNRQWGFVDKNGKFGAKIDDQDFLNKLHNGELNVPMRPNILMKVSILRSEELIDGVWHIKSRKIDKIFTIKIPESQGEFDL